MLERLADLGMALADAAAQRALADWQRPQNGEAPAAEAGTPQDRPVAEARPRVDHGLTFARLSRAVRQTIALEARIAAGDLGPARRHRPAWASGDPGHPGGSGYGWSDPRRREAGGIHPDAADRCVTVIRRMLRETADAETGALSRAALYRDIEDRLDDLSDLDPDGDLPAGEIIDVIAADLGLRPDLSRLSDADLLRTRSGIPASLDGFDGNGGGDPAGGPVDGPVDRPAGEPPAGAPGDPPVAAPEGRREAWPQGPRAPGAGPRPHGPDPP